ncbi:hypothetical protein FQA39_LY13964 [Lamprigera yunnana]|nr:hypothetical protein FQA39_LY13964 [Lamprigera yunnana]
MRDVLIKNGYGFVEFDDYRDADDAVYELNGKKLLGERVTVERARGTPRGRDQWSSRSDHRSHERYGPPTRTNYRVIVENLSSRISWQDLKDYMRQAGEVTYADAHKQHRNEGVVEFANYTDMKNAIEKLDDTDLNGRRIRITEDKTTKRKRSPSESRSRSRSRSKRTNSRSRSKSHSPKHSKSRSQSISRKKSEDRSRSYSRKKSEGSKSRSRSPENSKRSISREPKGRSRSRSRSVRMSFLKLLQERKDCLKNVTTTVRRPDGRTFLENQHCNIEIQKTLGFVVDTKPDNVPAKIVDCIYIGSQDCCDSDTLSNFKFKFVLSLGIEPVLPDGIVRKFVKCLDLPETNIVEILKSECFEFILNAVNEHQNILIHCNAGISRSSSVIIGFLMLTRKLTYLEAFSIVKSKRHCIKPNCGFEKQLKSLEIKDQLSSLINTPLF